MQVKNLTKYRGVWMAFAILWVVWYHSGLELPVLSRIKVFGYGGVDIFMLASGLGCYTSLRKNPDVGQFLKKRAKKILPVYWLFLVFWSISAWKIGTLTNLAQWVGNVLCVQYLTGQSGFFNWYMGLLLLSYLLAPLFLLLAEWTEGKGKAAAVTLGLLISTIPFIGADVPIIIVTRFPIFYLGMLLGKLVEQDYSLSRGQIILLLLAHGIGWVGLVVAHHYLTFSQLWSSGLWWYPFVLITPGFVLLISLASMGLERCRLGKQIVRFFSWLGGYTFPLYLTHIMVFDYYKHLVSAGTLPERRVYWLACVFITFGLAALLAAADRKIFQKK